MARTPRLSQLQRELIPFVQLSAKEPIASIAKQLRIRERSARYNLSALRELGLIREAPFLNVYPLGYRYVNLYFSISTSHSSAVEKLIQALKSSPRVVWLAELGADFHFGISLLVQQVEEVKEILDRFSQTFPAIFFEKSYVFHLSLSVYPAKYLTSKKLTFPRLGYGVTGGQFAADNLDREILSAMSARYLISGRAIARELGQPHATVELRLRRMEKAGVIAGYWNLYDASKLGFQTLKLLVYAKGHHHALSEQLANFARQHPRICYFIECLGSWDFEIGIDAEEPSEVGQTSREILDRFGAAINTVRVVPMFKVHKWQPFSKF